MKVRARKASVTMSESEHGTFPAKKRRKDSGFWQKKDIASTLITSSTRKRRIEATTTSLCVVSSTGVRLIPAVGEASVVDEDFCRNLHLNFTAMDSSLPDEDLGAQIAYEECKSLLGVDMDRIPGSQEGGTLRQVLEETNTLLGESKGVLPSEVVLPRPSILGALFSPVFNMFKSHGEELSTSCQSSVEQSEPLELRVDSVEATTSSWENGNRPHHDSIMTPCSPQAEISEDMTECRFSSCSTLSPSDDHALSMKPSVGNAVVTLVDSTGDCIDWDPLDDKAGVGDERPVLDDLQGDGDMMTTDPADLFLAVEQSKSLECNDELGNGGDIVLEEEEEFEDIDPYLFIKRLPSLSEVVSPCRPLLLPRQTRRSPPITLVLDLDETLVHSTLELCDDADFSFPVHFDFQEHMVYVRRRPHLQMFMERVAQLFEIIVFTASQSVYAEQLLNVLDPKRKLIRHRIFRDSCVFVRGNYLKDLTILGRDLSKVAIIDNSPQAYGFQVDNGIPIESWFDDRSDSALSGLLPFLETLVGVDDVRPIIAKRFNLRGKIAAAAELPYLTNRGDPLDRFS